MFAEPLLTRWPLNKLVREKALEVTMKHIHYEDENSRYINIACAEKVCISINIYKRSIIKAIVVDNTKCDIKNQFKKKEKKYLRTNNKKGSNLKHLQH